MWEEDANVRRATLEAFGELLVKRVRDNAIVDWDMITDGRSKAPRLQQFREMISSSFDDQQFAILKQMIPEIVDSTLHHLLWTLEQVEWVDIAVQTEAGSVPSLREVSDGLAGDLVGWIPRFSEQRYDPPYFGDSHND